MPAFQPLAANLSGGGSAIWAHGESVTASPALQAREREIVAEHTRALGTLIGEETDAPSDDLEPLVVARALMGAHRAVVDHVRSQVLAGRRARSLAADARSQIKRAFDRLERGLGDYAVKP